MTAMFRFPRNGKTSEKTNQTEDSCSGANDLPPEVTRSSSEETTVGHASTASTASTDEDGSQEGMERPATPDGLRPRKTIHDLHKEFKLPPHVLDDVQRSLQPVVVPTLIHPGATIHPAILQPTAPIQPSPAVQPVTAIRPSTTAAFTYAVPNGTPNVPPPASSVVSPQVTTTTTSLYSREGSSITPTAESPNLAAPVTAVGALVAQTQPRTTVLPPRHPAAPSGAAIGVLPPRVWGEQERDHNGEDLLRYHSLNDSQEIVPTPGMRPPVSNNSSLDSQTTLSFLPADWRTQRRDTPNVSFSSQLGLVEDVNWSKTPYNFESIDFGRVDDGPSRELVVMEQLTNVSAISQSTTATHDDHSLRSQCSLHSLDSVKFSHASRRSNDFADFNLIGEEEMDGILMKRKRSNQRCDREQILLSIVERLQDDLKLITELEAAHETEEVLSNWFVKTPMDREGLLTGYPEEKRIKMLNFLQSIIDEMNTVQPEEYFMSPTHIDEFADTHDDLRAALNFLQSLIQMADPVKEQRWKCKGELRVAMDIVATPQSPDTVRGGDTSLFSLPSESTTPHTSNLSLTTTITTKISPYGEPSKQRNNEEVQALRRTIEIVASLLQKMTMACDRLMETDRPASEKSIKATEEIKRTYLQLVAIRNADLEAARDAFFSNVPPGPIVRQVSEEDASTPLPPPPTASSQEPRHLLTVFDGQAKPVIHLVERETSRGEVEDEDGEDLRRQVGSNDYESNDIRDQPEGCEREASDPSVRDFYHPEPLQDVRPCK